MASGRTGAKVHRKADFGMAREAWASMADRRASEGHGLPPDAPDPPESTVVLRELATEPNGD
jgi:hypothetical protein